MIRKFVCTLGLVGPLALAVSVKAGVYDVAGDFSINANPNGVWSYGYAATLGGSLTLYTDSSSSAGLIGWSHNVSLGTPSVFYNTTATTIASGTPKIAPYQAVFHPGPNQYSLYRFTAPATANYQLQAAFVGIDIDGTSTTVHILVNDVVIFNGTVIGFGPGTETAFNTALSLQLNDRVDFAVGNAGNGFLYDSTGIQATLVSTPKLNLQAISTTQVQFSWPTNFGGFTLESTATLPAITWVAATNAVIIQGQYFTLTLDSSLAQQFFRLRRP